MIHDWTKLYYHRMFTEPHSQVEYFLEKLKEETPQGDALISIWDKERDHRWQILVHVH